MKSQAKHVLKDRGSVRDRPGGWGAVIRKAAVHECVEENAGERADSCTDSHGLLH